MPWTPPAFVSKSEMIQSGHRYRRETETLWICSECGSRTVTKDGTDSPFFAVLDVGDKTFFEARGDFRTCLDAQVAVVLHS